MNLSIFCDKPRHQHHRCDGCDCPCHPEKRSKATKRTMSGPAHAEAEERDEE